MDAKKFRLYRFPIVFGSVLLGLGLLYRFRCVEKDMDLKMLTLLFAQISCCILSAVTTEIF